MSKLTQSQHDLESTVLHEENTEQSLDADTILYMAELAKLRIEEHTAAQYADDIDKVLSMMDTLSEVDTDEVEPLLHIHTESFWARSDEADDSINREHNQSIAPNTQAGLYLVPQVID